MSNDEENEIDARALSAVGPERLATLLAEVAMTNPCMRCRLQFELSAPQGENIAAALRQWMREFAAQTSFLDSEEVGEFARELDGMRIAVASLVSRATPDLAPDLMWQLFELAGTVFERTIEEGWEVSCVFDEACSDLVKVSADAGVEPMVFATKVVTAIISEQYGEYRALIPAIASAQLWAPAYVSEVKALLQRSLDEQLALKGGSNSERSRDLQYALRELASLSAA
ncbi:DUF6880 family protein [Burkholderia ubonensis]|uniref:DUF6880 family protein n=1 Tax=Burkholderia ubonensis TaxID=101571 RepID=UPI000756DE41|nr:DUF6880 family protein [Burkholderia ubonensis]KVD77431.1 hypothetical protein WI88_23435 [Burkholderia ubonensis]